jgi:hypothetical protein
LLNSGDEEAKDRLVKDFGTVLRESAVLTTFACILFGLLFNTSTIAPDSLLTADRFSLLVALFSITVALSLLVMPVIYHHCNTLTATLKSSSREATALSYLA